MLANAIGSTYISSTLSHQGPAKKAWPVKQGVTDQISFPRGHLQSVIN